MSLDLVLSPSLLLQNSLEISKKKKAREVITGPPDAPFPLPLEMGVMLVKLLIFRLLNSITKLFLATMVLSCCR